MVKRRPRLSTWAVILARSRWKPMSSRSPRARWERAVERKAIASNKFVLPWAFLPKMTLRSGWKSAQKLS